jgi:hypothetical protein
MLYRVLILFDGFLFSYPAAHLWAVSWVGCVPTINHPVRSGGWCLYDELMTLYNEQKDDNGNYYHQGDNADVSSLKQERIVSQYYMAVWPAVAEFFASILKSEPPNTAEQSPSWKANSHILLNQKVQCYVHRSLPLVPGWRQMFHFNIIVPSILCLPSDLLALCFLTKIFYFFSNLRVAFIPFPLIGSP